MKTGLFFGSFNPIHIGHLIIAQYMLDNTELDEVWFMVSPQNPFKEESGLMPQNKRLEMVKLAISGNTRLRASDFEFNLPKPSYTINTLTALNNEFPNNEWALIMGADNLENFGKWKNYREIMDMVSIYAYNREGYSSGLMEKHPSVKLFKAPVLNISATYVRECLEKGLSTKYLVTPDVEEFLKSEK